MKYVCNKNKSWRLRRHLTATANINVANAPTFATAHVLMFHYVPLLISTAPMHATASDDTHKPTQTYTVVYQFIGSKLFATTC